MDDPFAMSRTQSIGNLNRQTEQISTDTPLVSTEGVVPGLSLTGVIIGHNG